MCSWPLQVPGQLQTNRGVAADEGLQLASYQAKVIDKIFSTTFVNQRLWCVKNNNIYIYNYNYNII